jgi:hypothetical protein
LKPRSIAPIGASERTDSVGSKVFENLRGAGFAGPITRSTRMATTFSMLRRIGRLTRCQAHRSCGDHESRGDSGTKAAVVIWQGSAS